MVFLTSVCLLPKTPPPPRVWKRLMMRRMAWHMFGRRRNCYSISVRYVRRAMRFSTFSGKHRKPFLTKLWNTRISAACAEHGVMFREFVQGLEKTGIQLNRKVLQDIAIYEPRTFQSLCELVKARSKEEGLQAAVAKPPPGVITRGML